MSILWAPIWVVFLQRKGLNLTEIGLLEAGAWALTAALEAPTGAIADRWGRKASSPIRSRRSSFWGTRCGTRRRRS